MTATLEGERIDRREGNRSMNGPRTYRRVYLVRTSNTADGVDTVLAASGLPVIGAPYVTAEENDLQALVNDLTPVQVSRIDCLWEVAVSYSTGPESDKEDDDPLQRPVDVTWTFETFMVIATFGKDKDGKDIPVTMSNGEPFDPPPMIEHSRQILTVRRNERTIDPTFFADFQNATNENVWLGAEERTIKIKGIPAVKVTDAKDPDNKYWSVTYIFVYEDETWDIKGLNQGTYFNDFSDLDPDLNAKKKEFVTEGGQPRLGFLTLNGDELAAGADKTFTEVIVRKQRDFTKLKLEQAILDQLQNRVNR